MNLDRAEQLLALATNAGTTEDERRNAAMALCRLLKQDDFFPQIRSLIKWSNDVHAWLRNHFLPMMRLKAAQR